MSERTPEQIKEDIKLLEEYTSRLDDLSAAERNRANETRARLRTLQQSNADMELAQQRYQDLLDKTDVKDKEIHQRRLQEAEEQRDAIKANRDAYLNAQKEIDDAIKKSTVLAQQGVEEQRKKNQEAAKDFVKASNEMTEKNKIDLETIGQTIEGAFEGIGGAFSSMAESPEMVLASFAGFDVGIDALKNRILSMPQEMDTAFSSVVKNTNMGADSAKASLTAMMDPLYAARRDQAFKNLSEDSRLMANIGLTADDVGDSMQSLINGVAMFRPEFIESNKVQAAFIGNLTAGLKKVGVPIETSAKNLNRFTKAMGMAPKEAATGLKQLTGIADSLGLSFAQVSNNFAAVGGDMVQFGDRAITVFANLQAQATATGMSINELTDFAKGLDTFEGAAQKAQGLNAVLGGTFVSVTDLVNADFDEKIELMQDAMADAGIEFDQADRRMQQVIASAAGLSVEQAAKMFGNKEASEEMRDSVDDQAMSTEELEGKIVDAMSITEKATRSLSSMAGGIADFNKRLNIASRDINKTVNREFGDLVQKTQSSEAAVMGMVGGLEGMSKAAQLGGEGLVGLGKTFVAVAPTLTAVATTLTGIVGSVAAGAEVQEGFQAEEARKAAQPQPAAPETVEGAGPQASAPMMKELQTVASLLRSKEEAATEASTPVQIQSQLVVDGRVLAEIVKDQDLFLNKPDMLMT